MNDLFLHVSYTLFVEDWDTKDRVEAIVFEESTPVERVLETLVTCDRLGLTVYLQPVTWYTRNNNEE